MNASGATSGKSILVVEDERIVAMHVQRSLARLGYDVRDPVATADDAIRSAADAAPDLVLMDINIRGARDGIDAAMILRERFGVAVVFVTAYADGETVERAKRAEPLGYLTKPIRIDELKSAVEIALHKHELDRRLRARERWFATTLASIGDGIITTDAQTRVTYLNPAAEGLIGYTLDAARDRPIEELVAVRNEDDEPAEQPLATALRRRSLVRFTGSLVRSTGGTVAIADSAAPIVDDKGDVIGGVFVFADVTEQRRMRREIELSGRLAAIGTMVAGVAHELNNPLTFVRANVDASRELIAEAPARTETLAEIDEALADAQHGIERIRRIVADLRDFARPQDGAQSTCELGPAIERSIAFSRRALEDAARLVVELEDGLVVRGDGVRLEQVFVNLLLNAAQAIGAGSRDQHEIRVTARRTGDEVVVAVSDTGAGMSEPVRSRIFEPFFTTKDVGRGTGLGLSVSHGIIRSLGGSIRVESDLGRGTTVRVKLPLDRTAP